MTRQRTVGARGIARLTACTFLAMSPLAQADEAPAPFTEYRAAGAFYRDLAEAVTRAMWYDCDYYGYRSCLLVSARTSDMGYEYIYEYRHERPGGDDDWIRVENGGLAVFSCAPGFSIYQTAFGVPLGPYANRQLEVGNPFPVYCQANGRSSGHARQPAVSDAYDRGELAVREVSDGDRTVRWSVTRDGEGHRVQASSARATSSFLVSDDRVVVIDDVATVVYAADGTLQSVHGADGTSIDRQGRYDPAGRLDALLRRATGTLPGTASTGALGAVDRAGEAIKTLLDRPTP